MDWSALFGPGGATVVGLLLFFLYGQTRGWWFTGLERERLLKELEDKNEEIRRWQEMAINSLGLADQASRQAVKAVDSAARVVTQRNSRKVPANGTPGSRGPADK